MPILDPKRRAEAIAMGLDPDRYSAVPIDEPQAAPAAVAAPETSSAPGAFFRRARAGLIPSFGSAAGAAGLLSWLGGPEVGLPVNIALGLGGALGGGALAQKGQDMAVDALSSPEAKAQMERQATADQEQHPIASTLGGVASAIPSFELAPGASLKGLTAAYKLARGTVPAAEREAAMLAAKGVGANLGLGAATGVINPLIEGRSPTLEDVGMGAGQALLFGRHRGELGKIPGLGFMAHPEAGPVAGQQYDEPIGPIGPYDQPIGPREGVQNAINRSLGIGDQAPNAADQQALLAMAQSRGYGEPARLVPSIGARDPVGIDDGQPVRFLSPMTVPGNTAKGTVAQPARDITMQAPLDPARLVGDVTEQAVGPQPAPFFHPEIEHLQRQADALVPAVNDKRLPIAVRVEAQRNLSEIQRKLALAKQAAQMIPADVRNPVKVAPENGQRPPTEPPPSGGQPLPTPPPLPKDANGQTIIAPIASGSKNGIAAIQAHMAKNGPVIIPEKAPTHEQTPVGEAAKLDVSGNQVQPLRNSLPVLDQGRQGASEVSSTAKEPAPGQAAGKPTTRTLEDQALAAKKRFEAIKLPSVGGGKSADKVQKLQQRYAADKASAKSEWDAADAALKARYAEGETSPNPPAQGKAETPAKASQAFDALVVEHAGERGWTNKPDHLYANIGEGGDTASIKAKLLKHEALKQARRNAASDLGVSPDTVETPAGRAKLLEKLQQHLAEKHQSDNDLHEPAKLPKLGQMQKQGDLMSNQTEDFALTGQKGTDYARIEEAKRKAAADKAESEKGQTQMFQGRTIPAALAKRMISLPMERRSNAFGPGYVTLRQDVLEAITGVRPPKAKAGSTAVRDALAKHFGLDPTKMAGVHIDDAVVEKLEQAARGENPNNPFQPAQPNIPPEQLLSHPANRDLLAALERIAAKHNITLKNTDEHITTTEGALAAGVADIQQRLAKFRGSLATVDTGLHEIAHVFLDDLRTSANPAERDMYDRAVEIFRGNEEALVQAVGLRGTDLLRNRIEGNTLARFKAWAGDFWSWVKGKWGKANAQDLTNLMARRIADGEAVARGERQPLSSQDNLRYQPAAVREQEQRDTTRRQGLEEDIHKGDFTFPGLRGSQQAIRAKGPAGEHLANSMDGIQEELDHNLGKYRNAAIQSILTLSKKEQVQLVQLMDRLQENPGGPMPILSAKQEASMATLRSLFEQSGKDATLAGKKIFDEGEWRDMIQSGTFMPHSMSADTMHTIHEKPATPEFNRLRTLYKDWVMAGGVKGVGHGVDEPTAEAMWKERASRPLQAIPRATSGFTALERKAGLGLPPEMREMDLGKRITNYFEKYSHAMAWFKKVEALTPENNVTRSLIDATDQFGGRDQNSPTLLDGSPAHNIIDTNVEHAFQAILRNYTPGQRTVEAWDRLFKSLMLQTITGAGDFVGGLGNAMVHLNLGEMFSLMPKAVSDMAGAIKAGMRQNKISPIYSAQSSTMAGGGLQIEALSNTADHLNRAASAIYKISGRGALEQYGRGLLMSLGMLKTNAAVSRIMARTHSANDVKWMNNFAGKGWEEAMRSGGFTTDHIEKSAGRFVSDVQGNYTGQYVPHWAIAGQLAPFFSLAKWNIEMANRFTRNVLNPLVRKGDPGPFLKMTLGAMAAGEIIHAVRQLITGKRGQDADWSEIAAAGGEGLPYRMMANAAFSGYGGLYADIIKQAFDLSKGNQAQGFRFPLIGAITTTADRVKQLAVALDAGENPIEMVGIFAKTFALDNVQMARATMRFVSEDEARATESVNAARNLKSFRLANGYPVPSQDAGMANPFMNPLKHDFQQTDDVGEAVRIAPQLIQQAIERSGNDPERLKAMLNNDRGMASDQMPSMTARPQEFAKYLQWLSQTQGPEAAQAAMVRYQRKQMMDQAKGTLIPRL